MRSRARVVEGMVESDHPQLRKADGKICVTVALLAMAIILSGILGILKESSRLPQFAALGYAVMNGIYLEIPGLVPCSALFSPSPLEVELRRRFVASMYADELVGGSAACLLSHLEKANLHDWLTDHIDVKPLCCDDYALERRNLDEWLNET